MSDNYDKLEELWVALVDSKHPGFSDVTIAPPAMLAYSRSEFNASGFNWTYRTYKSTNESI